MSTKRRSRRTAKQPFRPRAGATPPLLAGRRNETTRLRSLCEGLSDDGAGAHGMVVLIGPRGNGKTALLGWLEQFGEREGIDTAWLTPRNIPTTRALAELLGGGARLSGGNIGVEGEFMGASASVHVAATAPAPDAPPDLARLLAGCANKRPFALMVDEAHTLDRDVGADLLNAAQIASSHAPFLLVLAGTPDIEDALNAMRATFWDRSLRLPVGRLGDRDARLAIEGPLANDGVALGSEALWDRVLEACQGYPYFVQLVGAAVWESAFPPERGPEGRNLRGARGETLLDEQAVAGALHAAEQQKQVYYSGRCYELRKLGLRDCAVRVAKCFRNNNSAHVDVVEAVIKRTSTPEGAEAALRALRHLGYVWAPPIGDTMFLEPGLPSLMRFVVRDADGPEQVAPGWPRST